MPKTKYLEPKKMSVTLERIPDDILHLRIPLFTADLDSGEHIEVDSSGACVLITIKDPKWEKKNPGQISPYRYYLSGRALLESVVKRYEADKKAGVSGKRPASSPKPERHG